MSPRTTEQLQEVREISKNKILDAALKLFAERGFHNTSISQITKEAGVSKGLLYNYFQKKEELIDGIVGKAMAEGEELMREMMAQTSPQAKLRFIINAAFAEITERKEYYKLITSLSLQLDHFKNVKEIVFAKYQNSIPFFASLLEEVGVANAEEEAMVLAATMDGIGAQYIVLGEILPIERLKQSLFKRFKLA